MLPGIPLPRKEQIEKLNKLGESEVRYLISCQTIIHQDFDRRVAEEWLRQKVDEREEDTISRRDAREEETLEIARKASLDARDARIMAIIATAIAAAATIIAAYIASTF